MRSSSLVQQIRQPSCSLHHRRIEQLCRRSCAQLSDQRSLGFEKIQSVVHPFKQRGKEVCGFHFRFLHTSSHRGRNDGKSGMMGQSELHAHCQKTGTKTAIAISCITSNGKIESLSPVDADRCSPHPTRHPILTQPRQRHTRCCRPTHLCVPNTDHTRIPVQGSLSWENAIRTFQAPLFRRTSGFAAGQILALRWRLMRARGSRSPRFVHYQVVGMLFGVHLQSVLRAQTRLP